MRIRDVDQFVVVLEIEVVMRGHVGVEIGLGAVDTDLPQQARIGQLVERVVDGGERYRHFGEGGFLVQHFRGQMPRALAEQEPAQRHALTGGAQARRLQHFVDVMPGTAGQQRLAPGAMAVIDGVVIQIRGFVVHSRVPHRIR
jgi:hypothetical protein